MAVRTATLDRALLCEPVLSPRIWGGRRLELLGKDLPADEKIGESWEIADIDEGTSRILNLGRGPVPLSHAMKQFGEQLAPTSTDGRYPLLVKFLDVHQDTSIQVHPDLETCRRFFPEEHPKTETWVVIHSEPGATLYHDLKEGTSHAKFAWHARNGTVEECLREVRVEPGCIVHVPAGTVHALRAGVMVLEIQQPSDSTFRLHDFGRLDEHGNRRELHIEEAIRAATVADDRPALIWPDVDRFDWGACELVVECGAYRISRLTLESNMSWSAGPGRAFAATVIAGELQVQTPGWSGRLSRGDSALIPADIGRIEVQPRAPSTVIVAEPNGG